MPLCPYRTGARLLLAALIALLSACGGGDWEDEADECAARLQHQPPAGAQAKPAAPCREASK